MSEIALTFDPNSSRSYQQFLAVRRLPIYRFSGRSAIIPAEYAPRLGLAAEQSPDTRFRPNPRLFDYQRDIAKIAIRKRKYAAFIDCGLGKTLVYLEFARHAMAATGKPILMVCPLMVVRQTISEAAAFYGPECPIKRIAAADLQEFLDNGTGIGITNYDVIREGLTRGNLGGLILDESSMLKSHYGKWGTRLIALGRGLEWKMAGTGTPAPNDRIEFANHAVFLDRARTVNEFLARYFVNRGETDDRWELRPHATRRFYSDLSDWSIFMANPATYGWSDNVGTIPPIHVHIHEVDLTAGQRKAAQQLTGNLMTTTVGGIGQRGKLSQIAKGKGVDTHKPAFIRNLVDSWPAESTLIWCHYNDEQDSMERTFPMSASIRGDTCERERMIAIEEFQAGSISQLVTKPKILGFGINLQVATRQVFSGLQDSYEQYYQAVKRSNRVGSTRPLNVHIPVTELEEPMVANVLRKAKRVQADTEEQERLFRELGLCLEV